jgi:hypothetical protein
MSPQPESVLTHQLQSRGVIGSLIGNKDSSNVLDSALITNSQPPTRPQTTLGTPQKQKPTLSPSPKFKESRGVTKDDIQVPLAPFTPKRPSIPRGLSLQMPPNIFTSSKHQQESLTPDPLSPKLDASQTYGSTASPVLPRRSRGLDFSRASTNLHHSTLAEQQEPDSSPTLSGRGMAIPPGKRVIPGNWTLDSPSHPSSIWTSHQERNIMSSSLGSVNMDSADSGSSDSDEDDMLEHDDPIITTPHVYKVNGVSTPFGPSNLFAPSTTSPGGEFGHGYSPAQASLMSFQRARLGGRKSRKSSSSASGGSSMQSPSPIPMSPPVTKESGPIVSSYFAKDIAMKGIESRRSSLSLGTRDLHISSGGESDEATLQGAFDSTDPEKKMNGTPTRDAQGVIRRPVTRRGNLLPKTKTFARIRAALMEESTPVDSEVRREAEVIRQVRDRDDDPPSLTSKSALSSPILSPKDILNGEILTNIPEDENMGDGGDATNGSGSLSSSFSKQVKMHSGGANFWDRFENGTQTPPPPLFPRGSSAGLSEFGGDMNMESPGMSSPILAQHPKSSDGPPGGAGGPSAADISRKVNAKRRRDDSDFDLNSFKRRAVSPGVSVQNSPVLAQSPSFQKGEVWGWGLPKINREGSGGAASTNTGHGTNGERTTSGGSTGSSTVGNRKSGVGFQGMVDTNDGLMKMNLG